MYSLYMFCFFFNHYEEVPFLHLVALCIFKLSDQPKLLSLSVLVTTTWKKMPLHKYPPRLWEALKLQKGIYTRLPQHYLRALQDTTPPTPVHWKPLGVKHRANPKTGQQERVQDIPVPIYYPPESQDGLWGGEGWIKGYRYANGDKVVFGWLILQKLQHHEKHSF